MPTALGGRASLRAIDRRLAEPPAPGPRPPLCPRGGLFHSNASGRERRRRPLTVTMASGRREAVDFLPRETEPWEGMVLSTISHYDKNAVSFWAGTKDHDVSQNREALLEAMGPPLEGKRVLDLGCGPGRDIAHFQSLGMEVTGLDGSLQFVRMAREHTGAEVLHQDFHKLALPESHFDGIFANASLFHVYRAHLPGVLSALQAALVPGGVLFSSNPRADEDMENFTGRYGYYMCYETYARLMGEAGLEEVGHFYRPPGQPRHNQPWLASTWRKPLQR